MLVDAHCHLDLYPDPKPILEAARAAEAYVIAVTNTPAVFCSTELLVAGFNRIRPALGLHPELIPERAQEITLFRSLLTKTRYVGEVGLDYSTVYARYKEKQRAIFGQILEQCASYLDKVITIHSRRAVNDVLAAVGDKFAGRLILHWFTGSVSQVEQAAALGFYFSVNPAMTRSNHGRRLIAAMPVDRVLTESDGPFVTCGSKPATPMDVIKALHFLSGLWQQDLREAADRVRHNFKICLSLNR